jgi:GT2 family glycosyltransferase
MTGTVEFQNLCISIAYEVKMVMRDNTLSFYQKLIFCFLKIVCVTGFAFGRECPEKRTRAPTLPPPIPTFFATEKVEAAPLPSTESAEEKEKPSADDSTPEARTDSQELTAASADVELSEFRPTVAIVAPIFVRTLLQRKEVLELISSLDNQTYKAAQIILVDDCSPFPWYMSSATGQSEENLVKLPANTRLVRRPKNHGPAAARSLGLGLAMTEHQAQIVNFIDSDCEADSHWVEAMVTAHYYELKKKTEGSDGAILSGLTHAYGNTQVDKFHDHFGTLNGRIRMNGDGLLYAPSCNISIRISQKLVSQVGGFDESFPKAAFEDVDYCMRASQCGFLTQCVQNAKIWHKYQTTIPQLFRMFQRYGASEWAVLERHPYYFEMYGASYQIPSQAPKVVT